MIWLLSSLLLSIHMALCYDGFFISSLSVTDHCVGVCNDLTQPPSNLTKEEQEQICQKGCRFLNIIRFKSDLSTSTSTQNECHSSCNDSYSLSYKQDVCIKGCDLMATKSGQMLEISASSFIIMAPNNEEEPDVENSSNDNNVLSEPDLEILETDDLLSDPSIRSQLEIGFDIDYKIPETHIRTMPIAMQDDKVVVVSIDKEGSSWLDCASRGSGIPTWILLWAILLTLLVALYVSVITTKWERGNVEVEDDERSILESQQSESDMVVKDYPPKYSLENETVK